MTNIEYHPLKPFLPLDAKLLMLGSFPPKKERWSMDFYYPNLQNDMWRIFGLVFYEDKNYFLNSDNKLFDRDKIESFLIEKGIAIYDIAQSVIRQKDNASDKYLEIVQAVNLKEILSRIPNCIAIATTGQKASDTLAELIDVNVPKIGSSSEFSFEGRQMSFYRMPSSSRAYPLSLQKKAEFYREMFQNIFKCL